MEQRTNQWYRHRLGKITGSRVGDLMSSGKTKGAIFSAKGLTYLNEVASERMLPPQISEDDMLLEEYLYETTAQSKAMRIGTERESEARELYCKITGNKVIERGSLEHQQIKGFSSSPDGIIGDNDGVVEIKCPTPSKYMEYLTQIKTAEDLKVVNPLYYWQCMANMAITGARWCDFTCYCPFSMKPLHIVSIMRDEKEIELLEDKVRKGQEYIDNLLKAA